MTKSLQDQLLNAGLVNKEQVSKANASKRKKNRQQRNSSSTQNSSESNIQYQKNLAEKAKRDRELNKRQSNEKDSKALASQIRQLVTINRINQSDDGEAFNFDDKGRVKTVYVSSAARSQITRGILAIVKLDNRYEIVPAAVAQKIRSRNASLVIVFNETKKSENDGVENDPYADYQVPDDLIW